MVKRMWLLILALLLAAAPAMADQIDGLASSGQNAPAQLQDLHVNPGGLGDVLIFPYYNARTGLNYYRIVNTSDRGVVGKLRLREGRESEEVLDFIVCLSPHDEFTFWVVDPQMLGLSGNTAAVLRGDSGTGLMADTDTVVAPGDWTVALTRTTTSAGKNIPAERTFEGYIEFFATGAIQVANENEFHLFVPDAQACLELVQNGQVEYQDNFGNRHVAVLQDAPNVLMGEGYLFNLVGLTDADGISTYAYEAVALANFRTQPLFPAGLTQDAPLFADASAGLLAVNYALTRTNLYAFYDLQSYVAGQTDLLLNFVTKKENVDNNLANQYYDATLVSAREWAMCVGGQVGQETFQRGTDYTKCCIPIQVEIYDDKENHPAGGVDFSPAPPGQRARLCYEVSYITVGSGQNILTTELNEISIGTPYQLGWLGISFGHGNTVLGQDNAIGQPVLGYQIQSYLGGAAERMAPMAYDLLLGGQGGQGGGQQQNCQVVMGHQICCNTDCAAECGADIACIAACQAWQANNCP